MAMVLCCHLGLLMLMFRPGLYVEETAHVLRSGPVALQLRFFRRPQQPAPPAALQVPQFVASTRSIHIHAASTARPSKSLLAQPAPVGAPAPETPLAETQPTTTQFTDNEASTGDGGFRERLLSAQRSHDVHGVPGSDMHFVPDIRLTDPMRQGVGAVMRKAQRLFGVTNRHCIDVEVWRHLTPQELSARHISSGDVDKIDEKYDCNRPPGLSI
jgi:hypothetical protein